MRRRARSTAIRWLAGVQLRMFEVQEAAEAIGYWQPRAPEQVQAAVARKLADLTRK